MKFIGFIVLFSLSMLHADEGDRLYRLDFGDRLSVAVYGEPDTYREVTVDNRGIITYPIIGDVFVLGKTIEEFREEMNEKLKEYYRFSFFNITPIEFGGQSYVVLGEVKLPGKKPILGNETILSALCRAGGFTTGYYRTTLMEFADLDHAFLLRRGEYVPLDFTKLITDGEVDRDISIRAGDYIYIPNAVDKEIYVLGEVTNPSPLGFFNQVSLSQAISMAGGLTIHAACRVIVVRGSLCYPKTYCVDYNQILRGCCKDFLLRPGDIVYVPPEPFTELRELAKYAVRIFTGSLFSRLGTRSLESIKSTEVFDDNVNVIPITGL